MFSLFGSLQASQLILGLIPIKRQAAPELDRILGAAPEAGANLFDLAAHCELP